VKVDEDGANQTDDRSHKESTDRCSKDEFDQGYSPISMMYRWGPLASRSASFSFTSIRQLIPYFGLTPCNHWNGSV
jgi:hypothetical protein